TKDNKQQQNKKKIRTQNLEQEHSTKHKEYKGQKERKLLSHSRESFKPSNAKLKRAKTTHNKDLTPLPKLVHSQLAKKTLQALTYTQNFQRLLFLIGTSALTFQVVLINISKTVY
ncbi:hypothetical protein TorRG33x02_316840, partial [Trema orientale]